MNRDDILKVLGDNIHGDGQGYPDWSEIEAAADALLAEIERRGLVLVPVIPTNAMIEAGTKADWVGEYESREGCSILPDAHETHDDNDTVEQRPGIWAAMLAARPR